jgi:demethylmenaquinone methyltransferase/2-methoxy-6-polyprenyl-1,4-benzoquinol methylase
MSSYVYMKILESQPRRYDRGIAWLSLGQSGKIKRRIVDELVVPGSRVLDIGCGTGALAVLAAKKGARVTGFDVSGGMLDVARRKVDSENLGEKIELVEMGIAGMDRLSDASFDLVASTLVFSELSGDERVYALRHGFRVLVPGGSLVLADEVRPESMRKRFVCGLLRAPLVLLTFLLTQTTTRPVDSPENLVVEAGFRIERAERSRLGSFLYLVGVKDEE